MTFITYYAIMVCVGVFVQFQIGFYYNTCTDKSWYDTGLRLPEMLCCDPKTGKANPTYKSCEEFDKNGKAIAQKEESFEIYFQL